MNLKQFFYKGYYTGINLHKPENKDAFKKIKDENSPLFNTANEKIKGFSWSDDAMANLKIIMKDAGREMSEISLETTYPGLLIGSGYTHETNNENEFKLGFYFDHTTGLPVIPGSSVKGTLRSVFPQFKNCHPLIVPHYKDKKQEAKAAYIAGLFGLDGDNDTIGKVHQLELMLFEGVDVGATKANFEKGSNAIAYLPSYRQTCFYNAIIYKPDLQGKILGTDSITPHGDNPLKNPVPLPFLKILPRVVFDFQLLIGDTSHLGTDKKRVISAFTEILTTIGIGAKTNVGYGQFIEFDPWVIREPVRVPKFRMKAPEPKKEELSRRAEKAEYDPLGKYKSAPKATGQAAMSTASDEWPDIQDVKVKGAPITAKIITIAGTSITVQPYIKGLSDGYTLKISLGKYDDIPFKTNQEIKIQLTDKKGHILQAKIIK